MAGHPSIAAVGRSLERLLTAAFAESDFGVAGTRAVLARTEDFATANLAATIPAPALSIFLYRVDFNKTMRAAWSAVGFHDGRSHLPLDLHYLITPWGENAQDEHAILGKALEFLERNPILTGPLLHPTGTWQPHEAVQIVLEEVSTEAVMRTFDSLPTDYKLSVPYIARVVRLESARARPAPDVVEVTTGAVPDALAPRGLA